MGVFIAQANILLDRHHTAKMADFGQGAEVWNHLEGLKIAPTGSQMTWSKEGS